MSFVIHTSEFIGVEGGGGGAGDTVNDG